jgi:hypothetical protein
MTMDFSTGVRTGSPGPAPWGKIITEALTTAGSVTLFFSAGGVVGLLYYLSTVKGVLMNADSSPLRQHARGHAASGASPVGAPSLEKRAFWRACRPRPPR